jgi:hypothetical protein
MKERGLGGRLNSFIDVVVDGTWPDSKVIKWHLRRMESRERRVPYEARFGDVVAGLDGSLCSGTGFACARLLDRCPGWCPEEVGGRRKSGYE